ncbi:MAG: autotransporter outer membrane beta-barrel domain-containing protein, partial [Geobacteraceae bacterium]|nr:autotransporter outer membrane beta-barrel domain-containing protein [Geobacteraceae bacterium]
QRIVADYEYSLLLAPSQISLAAESAVQTGLAHLSSIQGHLDLSDENREDKRLSAWFSAGANNRSLNNSSWFPSTTGVPYGSTMGVDYKTNSKLVVGAAISAGKQTQQFSSAGHFNQVDETLSLYTAYKKGTFWADAVTSYGLFQDHISRPVTLGMFTDNNNGNTTGHSLSLSLRVGSVFNLGEVITGPIAGVVVQRVILDEYTESGYSGVTALSFGSQTRDACISQFGWQGSLNTGKGQLFGKIGWNHDWAAKNREITVSVTSAVAAPYTADAAPVASDWGTASLGFSHNLYSNVKLQSTISTMFVNPQVVSYGGELGLNVIF